MTDRPAAPAGWYMDPSGSNNMRYWDGAQWTEHVGAPPPQGQSFDATVNQTVDSVAKAFQDSKGSQVISLPAPYEAAFAAAVESLPSISMSVRSADAHQGVIVASTGMSLTSWGEDITIRLQGAEDGQTTNLWMESKMKFGLVNWGKHEKNFNAIANAVHARLTGGQSPVPPQPQPQPGQPQPGQAPYEQPQSGQVPYEQPGQPPQAQPGHAPPPGGPPTAPPPGQPPA